MALVYYLALSPLPIHNRRRMEKIKDAILIASVVVWFIIILTIYLIFAKDEK